MKVLLEAGANVHAEYDYALREASFHGHLEVVRPILEAESNAHAWYNNAIRLANYNDHIEVVKLLEEHARSSRIIKRT